jgi:Flp pilus assembly protein TadG
VACGGTAAIEFALIAPMFLMLVFGGIEFSRLLWTQEALQQTAVAGARCMAIAQGAIQNSACASGGTYSASTTKSQIETIASGWGLSVQDSDITLDNTTACGGTTGVFSQVTINISFTTPVPQFVLISAGAEPMTATACYPNNPF